MEKPELNDFEVLSRIIRNRRSIFPVQFGNEKIPQDFIDQMLELGNWAPTHRRTEPWRYIVVSGQAKTRLGDFLATKYEEISEPDQFKPSKQKKIRSKCEQSQVVILICMQRDVLERLPEWEEVASVAMSVQNMWLACAASGIGCYWSSPAMINYIDEFVAMNEGMRCLGLFYMGLPEGKWPSGLRQPMVDKVQFMTA